MENGRKVSHARKEQRDRGALSKEVEEPEKD